jgi:hypothetical protein
MYVYAPLLLFSLEHDMGKEAFPGASAIIATHCR